MNIRTRSERNLQAGFKPLRTDSKHRVLVRHQCHAILFARAGARAIHNDIVIISGMSMGKCWV